MNNTSDEIHAIDQNLKKLKDSLSKNPEYLVADDHTLPSDKVPIETVKAEMAKLGQEISEIMENVENWVGDFLLVV